MTTCVKNLMFLVYYVCWNFYYESYVCIKKMKIFLTQDLYYIFKYKIFV